MRDINRELLISFWDEDDYEYEILSIAHGWASVILVGKHDGRRLRRPSTTSFSENVVMAGTSYQVIKLLLLLFCHRERA